MIERKLFTKKLLTPVNVEDVIPCEHVVLKSGSRWQGFNLSLHHHPPYEFDTVCFNVHILTLSVGGMTRLWQYKDGRTHQGTHIRGDFTFNPARVLSSMRWDSDVEILNILIDPWFIQKIADESSAANSDQLELVPVFQARDPHIEHIGQSLLKELQTEGLYGRLYAESLTTALAVYLLRNYSTIKPTIREYEGGLPSYRLSQVLEYLNSHLDQNVKLSDLAEVAGMSQYYFCRLFKQSMGMAPHQYVIQQRVERAKLLLRHRDRAIAGIALECGFYNQSHFTKHFRQLTGITPKAYRETYRNHA